MIKLKTIVILCCCIAGIMIFSYSLLPVSMFEASGSYAEQLQQEWLEKKYSGDNNVAFSGIFAFFGVLNDKKEFIEESFWDKVTSVFASIFLGEDESESAETAEQDDLKIASSDNAQKKTIQKKATTCMNKVQARIDCIEKAINDQEGALTKAVKSHYSGDYDTVDVEVSVSSTSLSLDSAIQLMSLYTTQMTGALETVQMGDLLKWLGWYDSRDTGTVSFPLGDSGVNGSVKAWNGTFMPTYLLEQAHQEKVMCKRYGSDLYGEETTDYTEYQCPAVDYLIYVDCPNIADMPVMVTTETRVSDDDKTIKITHATVVCNIQINLRDETSLEYLAGLWAGSQDEGGEPIRKAPRQSSNAVASGASGSYNGVVIDGTGQFIWPLPSNYTTITSKYGWRICPFHGKELHNGVDIQAPAGTPIYAADTGTVTLATYGSSYGNNVVIKHGSTGQITRYCHMTRYVVSPGQDVQQGEIIGYVGSTGSSTGNHLHFMIGNGSLNNTVNPLTISYKAR